MRDEFDAPGRDGWKRAAYHEARHSAAAIIFGIPIIRVTIASNIPHLHRGRYGALQEACFVMRAASEQQLTYLHLF